MTRTGVCSASTCTRPSLWLIRTKPKDRPTELCGRCASMAKFIGGALDFEVTCEMVGVIPEVAAYLGTRVEIVGSARNIVTDLCLGRDEKN